MLTRSSRSADPWLVVEGVSRSFVSAAETVRAVRDADLTAHQGEFVCVFGASGSGKSTLINLIAGLDTADAGRILVGQADLGLLGESRRARLRLETIGVVFQDHNLIEEFTALENVALPLEALGVGRRAALRQASAQLARVGLGGLGDRVPSRMSGGQRQRVGIARALVGERRVLLADEPTGALDSRSSRELFELIRVLCDQGSLAVVCSHDERCQELADTVYEMVDGRPIVRERVS
ncbi:putative ABC transport system ATP-binding protein [Saccharothrix tamanrassetensis]|uniref:Putative ABC transport system ATP-binding protein n=1 Tax=Saccharothrix tamanrassetensis TaxID=1051531 RepID=A0A841CM19_9PSEU|nr:ABC transporter ATP-binding protein [Saccharothrix tamanrassetensis]MBB5958621.1 putative ABC transport system ATP-binding protein [Saccharothrix tamanrassetensis]